MEVFINLKDIITICVMVTIVIIIGIGILINNFKNK